MGTPRTVHVFVFDTLADWEVGHAMAGIGSPRWQREPGRYQLKTVGRTREPVRTTGGLTIVPDLTLEELQPAQSAMLLLPGGEAWDRGELDDVARRAGDLLDQDVTIAAICGATAGLARAGLLDDRAHTSNAAPYLAATGYAGASLYREEPAVTDRGVITANTTAPVDFARHVFEALALYPEPVLEAWHGLFRTGEPHYFGALMAATSA